MKTLEELRDITSHQKISSHNAKLLALEARQAAHQA